jgi:hypothetical protein
VKRDRSKRGAWFLVEGVNVGDGERSRVWLHLGVDGVLQVRRFGSRTVWTLPMDEAAGLLARQAQLRAIAQGAR